MKSLILTVLILFLISCTNNNGGGVTVESPPPTTPIDPPVVTPEQSVFNLILSEIYFINDNNEKTTNLPVGTNAKLVVIARDQFGNRMSGLNLKMGLQYTLGYEDLTPIESEVGKYEINLSFSFQGDFTGYLKLNNVLINIYNYLNVSYCNGQGSGINPFHSEVTISSKNYYVICNSSQLALIGASSTYVNSNFILGKEIDLSTFYVDQDLDNIPDNQFLIGSEINPFTGEFLGSGYSIKGFKYKNPLADNIGLFSFVANGSKIKSLTILNAEIVGRNSVGIIGKIENTTATNSIISSIIVSNSTVVGLDKIGGLIGEVNVSLGSVLIERNLINLNFNFNGTANNHSQIGGLIGLNVGSEVYENTVFSNFTYTDNLFTISKLGGLIGEESGFNNSKITFSNVTSTQLYTSGDQIGCLVGFLNQGQIKDNSYGTTCFIDHQNSNFPNFSGGLFGKVESSLIENISAYVNSSNINSSFGGLSNYINNSQIIKSNISGTITSSSSNIGGIVGNSIDSSYSKVSSYVSITITGGANSIGGIIGNSQNNLLTKVNNYGYINASNASIVGGLIGNAIGTLDVNNSYNSGHLSNNSILGGIIGNSSDNSVKSILNVYNNGILTSNSFVGGILGINDCVEISINNVFSIGKIKNSSNNQPANSGSLIGDTVLSNQLSQNNYFLSESTAILVGCSGLGCSSFSMNDTDSSNGLVDDLSYYSSPSNAPLSSWDFNLIWNTYSTNPPYLR